MLVKKGQNTKMCYLRNKNGIHISSAYTCTSKLLYIHQYFKNECECFIGVSKHDKTDESTRP